MKRIIISLSLALIVIMVISACGSAAAPTSTKPPEAIATSAPQPTTSSSTASAKLTDAQMEALITEKVHDKHTLDFILSKNKTADEWSQTLDIMIGFGAKISPDEKTMMIDWLVNRKK